MRRRYGLTLEHRQETFPLDLGWTEAATGQEIAAAEPAPPADPRLVERLRETALWQYHHESRTKIPAKLAVTDLVRQQEETDGPRLPLPAFTQAIGFTPAQKGSIFHRALQFADYAAGRRDPDGELARLADRGYLTEAEAGAVSRKRFAAFFRSPLMDRILQADRVLREYRFFSTVPAAQAGYEGAGDILIQGIADCVLEEKGAGVILDYKTDAAPPEELVRRYGLQLALYRRALEPLFPNGIKECLIYSAYSDRTVPVPDISEMKTAAGELSCGCFHFLARSRSRITPSGSLTSSTMTQMTSPRAITDSPRYRSLSICAGSGVKKAAPSST